MLTSAPFSTRLRSATMSDHEQAEVSAFMTAVMGGRADEATYAALVVQLQPIYAALDTAAAAHRGHATLGAFFDPRLTRAQALHADLEALGASHPVTDATRAYCDRVSEVATDPLLVLAHHYTRYLGDLSGGRAIAARLASNLGLTPERGLAFYQFDIGPAPAYKNVYRARLDGLTLTPTDQTRFVSEVSDAYALNRGVFASLDALL